ncbi:MAG: DNA repair protein RecO [Bryobacteraceae bacterium]|nr:DNA repair protein RecO [Bryobacteraceae bacterium]
MNSTSDALILRSYPFGEADLIVSYFTRDLGKLRGVAKRVRKPKSAYGAGLERMSLSRVTYTKRENRDLTTIIGAEVLSSPFDLTSSYDLALALDFMAEVGEHLLQPEEVNERYFRLILSMLEYLRATGEAGLWPAVTYYSLWAVRLSGFLPELRLVAESAAIAEEMLSLPIAKLTPRTWDRETARDLRRLLAREIEQQIERKLFTAPMLESLA